MDTQTQIERLIELAIVQRTELKQLVEQLPQLRDHLTSEVEKTFEEAEPQLRSELEEFCEKRATDANAKVGTALEARIASLAADLQVSTQARFDVLKEQERKLEALRAEAQQEIAAQVATMPEAVKEIVTAELARFPRAGEIDQLRKEFAEPRGLNPRGKWQAGETYNKLDLVTINGDSFVSNVDGNRERPSRSAANWTLSAARGNSGGGGGITSLNDVLNAPTAGQIVGSENGQYVPKTLVAGANITINETASTITIIGDEGQISLQDGTAAAPSLFFTNDTDTGLYRPAANTVGISVSGTQVAYFDANGLTVPSSGVVAGGSIHAANGNANNPSLSFSGDQDTGFFRHQPNELGIALGGTQYATLTSTTFSITPNVTVAGTATITGAITGSSLTGPTTTDLTLAGGSSGASLVLGQGTTAGGSTITNTGTGGLSVVNGDTANVLILSRNTLQTNTGTSIKFRSKDGAGTMVDIGDIYAYKSVATAGAVDSWFAVATRRAGTLTDALFISPLGNFLIGGTTDITGSGGLKVYGTTSASSSTTGALQIGGATAATGVGIGGGNINAGGTITAGGTLTVGDAITGPTLAPGLNTPAHYFSAFGASTGWPMRLSTVYDSNYVDQYITLNGTLTGTRGSPTFTGAATGGAFIKLDGATSNLSFGRFGVGAGQTGVTALTLTSAGNTTLAGNLTVSGTGTSSVAGSMAIGRATRIGTAALTIAKATNKNLQVDTSSTGTGVSVYASDDADSYNVLQLDGSTLELNKRSGGSVSIASTTDASSGAGALVVSGGAYIEKKVVTNSSITTAAPSGGTAGAWKLGVRVAATTTLDTTQYLQVDIGGTLYKVALVTS